MKHILFISGLLALLSPSAFAFKKVQFDVDLRLDICPLKDGKNCSEIDGGPGQFRETLVATSDEGSSDLSISKEYKLERVYGVEYDVVLAVSFSPAFKNSKNYFVEMSLNPPESKGLFLPEAAGLFLEVPDPSALASVAVYGMQKLWPMQDGPNLIIQPNARITNIKVLE